MTTADSNETDQEFEALLDFIHQRHGFDFRGYKRSSLCRRIEKRMKEVGRADFADYLAFLEVEPREYAQLVNTVLINVTAFFRDEPAWTVLQQSAIPQILRDKAPDDAIRVWSAGCATGEEAYSLAMIVAEAIGVQDFQRRVKIYATDLDEAALAAARNAVYPAAALASIPDGLVERYFEETGGSFTFRRDLRKSIIFGRHNLLSDAPISRVDLLACRNLLIYLDIETQAQVLPRLHYAMTSGGILFLGKAETQIASSKLFEPIDLRSRIFRKRKAHSPRSHLDMFTAVSTGPHRQIVTQRLLEDMIGAAPVATIGVGADGQLLSANIVARRLFGLAEPDVGQPFHDLQLSYRPVDLRSRIEEAVRTRQIVRIEDVEYFRSSTDTLRLCVEVTPLFNNGLHAATAISFVDVTRQYELQQQLNAANHILETTIEELQSANEELETTNEELQSTNEELETTNEELQSTNEELETTNEELRSTNEELEATNEELRARTAQLDEQRTYTEAVLGSIGTGIIVADRELRVTSWNRWNENMWGMRRDETKGRSLLSLDVGLPLARIEDQLRRVLATGEPERVELAAVDRRGRSIHYQMIVSPLRLNGAEITGLVIASENGESRAAPVGMTGSGAAS
jgi:two-component system CheB/CheR fusion protein